ncbi:MAG TPA: hypothetical protein VHQ21_13545 [Rhodanobacteraceae bacterium]|nr:hypothetical protein [Rhodanobacteraceae bacterium]
MSGFHDSLGVQTARLEVETPRMTLMGAFTEYESNIKDALQAEMQRIVNDGTLTRSAVAELQKQLPEFIKNQVSRSMYELDFSEFLKPILIAAFKSITEGK